MSTQTEHIGLHQWESTDSFLREDFNEDNRKIDEEVGKLIAAVPIIKLGEITTSESARQVDVDLSEIDFSQYWEVQFHIHGNTSQTCVLYVRLNGAAGEEDYEYKSAHGNNYASNYLSAISLGYPGSMDYYSAKVTIFSSPVFISAHTEGYGKAIQDQRSYATQTSGVTFSTLQVMNLVASIGTIDAGLKIEIYGVKQQ